MDLLKIATTIRDTRKQQGLTLDALAKKAEITKGYLSRVENFRTVPTIQTLSKIADALGIEMGYFFTAEAKSPPVLFGSIDTGEEISRDNNDRYGMKYFSLAFSKIDRHMDPFTIEYYKAELTRDFLMHDSDEFFVLLSGTVEFALYNESGELKTLQVGDTVYLEKNIPHRVTLPDDCDYAKALVLYAG